jgi:peptidoglycan/xylan/chitin deacetylase (PgdA/CDA1 family)
MFVSPEHLNFQVRYLLKKGYEIVTLAEALARLPHEKTKPLACLTFDDGYVDNVNLGLPVLEKLGVPATVYVITGDVGKKSMIWQEAGEKHPADLASWDELGRLREKGWELANHGHAHVHFSRYSPAHQEDLIARSCEELHKYLGEKPRTFAYPYGDYNAVTVELMARYGFSGAVTTQLGANRSSELNRFELKRFPCQGFQFYHYLKWVLKLKRDTRLPLLIP